MDPSVNRITQKPRITSLRNDPGKID